MSDRERAIARLGAPHCTNCTVLGAPRARVSGRVEKDSDHAVFGCCSARCAIAVLDKMFRGVANIVVNQEKRGVIALRSPKKDGSARKTGIWPQGQKRLDIEARKAARRARS